MRKQTDFKCVENAIRAQEAAAMGEAYICPATDGGYVMLCLPGAVPSGVFDDVEWSSQNTCISQIQALRRSGVTVRVGPTFHDIDTPADIHRLLKMSREPSTDVWIEQQCRRTLAAVKEHCSITEDDLKP